MQAAIRPRGRIPNVAIVGAGIAGLRCADILIKSGARVTIYEARDRIGGRVHQVASGGHLVDMGANWIHGTENNPIADIARRTGTVTHEFGQGQVVIDAKGNRVDDDLASEIVETVWGTVVKAFKYSDENSANIDKSQSLMDYFREQVPLVEPDPKKQALILEEAHMWGAFVGDSVESQSLKFFFLEECIEGENVFVAGTYKKILADIAAVPLSKADVHYNQEVVFFDTHSRTQSSPPQVTIHTCRGKQQTYDEVVLTTPLGWLKHHAHDAFPSSSPLPDRLAQAIANTGYGRLEKVYVTFPTAFWQPTAQTQHQTPTPLPNSTPSASSAYPAFTHFLTPEYTPHPPNTSWNQSLVNLATLPHPTAHPTLFFYLYGDCGSHLLHLLKDQPPSTSPTSPYYQTLQTFLQPYYAQLPSYSPESANCQPTAFLATAWQHDRYAGYGSYTNFPVGTEAGDRNVEVMREGGGMGEERGVWFAGEHTAPFVALGTTTGAYWSGGAVARRIGRLYDGLQVVEGEED